MSVSRVEYDAALKRVQGVWCPAGPGRQGCPTVCNCARSTLAALGLDEPPTEDADDHEYGPISPGTPHARMLATWGRMREDIGDVEALTGWSRFSSQHPIEWQYVEAFRVMRDKRVASPAEPPKACPTCGSGWTYHHACPDRGSGIDGGTP